MLLGIDFGTTRTAVAAVNRGNYPIVSFHTDDGNTLEWYPSMVACREEEMLFGFDAAEKRGEAGWHLLRSFKSSLGSVGMNDPIELNGRRLPAIELLTGFLSALKRDLVARSNLRIKRNQPLETMISLPANANSNQRFITIEAFQRAGFIVRGMMNEPSAAAIEYAHLISTTGGSSTREFLVIYDLGGGTFDSSVISLNERDHEVLSSEGIAKLGGDNFDIILLDLALREAGIDQIPDRALGLLLEECRLKKEALHPNTRRIAIDLAHGIEGASEVMVTTSAFNEACRPLIESTIESMEQVIAQSARDAGYNLHESASVYLVGGSSDLPLVSRLLREKYGRQVRRSPYPHAATAIGLAIAADAEQGYILRERFTRHFGAWRESKHGEQIVFDPIFEKGTPLPAKGQPPLERVRRYRPVHNIGKLRYLECSRLDAAGQPQGDISPWNEILFPFDPALQTPAALKKLMNVPIVRGSMDENLIEEIYTCNANGIIEVEINDPINRFRLRFRLREGA